MMIYTFKYPLLGKGFFLGGGGVGWVFQEFPYLLSKHALSARLKSRLKQCRRRVMKERSDLKQPLTRLSVVKKCLDRDFCHLVVDNGRHK